MSLYIVLHVSASDSNKYYYHYYNNGNNVFLSVFFSNAISALPEVVLGARAPLALPYLPQWAWRKCVKFDNKW